MPALTPFAFSPPPVAALGDDARLLLKAMRMWVMLARQGQSPRPALAALLGAGGPPMGLLMDLATSAWPEPFTTYTPCASAVSPDEATLLRLLAHAEVDQRGEACALLADMLPNAERERLWQAAGRLTADRLALR
jgi:hypothetical protein